MPRYTARQRKLIKEKIVQSLSAGNVSMSEVCEEENMPDRTTIFRWRAKDQDFDNVCEKATAGGYDRLIERSLAKFDDLDFEVVSTRCADKIMKEVKAKMSHELTEEQIDILHQILTENAVDPKFANAQVQTVTNQFRAAMMFLSKRHPAKYGEKLAIDTTIEDKRQYSPKEREDKLNILLDRRKQLLDDDKNTKH